MTICMKQSKYDLSKLTPELLAEIGTLQKSPLSDEAFKNSLDALLDVHEVTDVDLNQIFEALRKNRSE